MKTMGKVWTAVISSAAIFLLILDSGTALQGAKEGVVLSLYTVIPSLFPIIVLSGLLSSSLMGLRINVLRPLGRLCGIPEGAEGLLVLGYLGGYPVGAQLIADAYRQGCIPKSAACRLMAFCSNAGPAFIFGIAGLAFSSQWAPLALWLIHITSSLLVGILLPYKESHSCHILVGSKYSLTDSLNRGVRIMASICSWVVMFRVILTVLTRWVLWILPNEAQIIITGILELSNGCIELAHLPLEGQRFIVCAVILGLGGLCVLMQTVSVAGQLGLGLYVPGKLLQAIFSFLLSCACQSLLFPQGERVCLPIGTYIFTVLLGGMIYWYFLRKKSSSNLQINAV